MVRENSNLVPRLGILAIDVNETILETELEQTVRCLVEAERTFLSNPRPASEDRVANNGCVTDSANASRTLSTGSGVPAPLHQELLLQYLYDKCRLLETQDSHDPVVRAYAKEAWEHDGAEAELHHNYSCKPFQIALKRRPQMYCQYLE